MLEPTRGKRISHIPKLFGGLGILVLKHDRGAVSALEARWRRVELGTKRVIEIGLRYLAKLHMSVIHTRFSILPK